LDHKVQPRCKRGPAVAHLGLIKPGGLQMARFRQMLSPRAHFCSATSRRLNCGTSRNTLAMIRQSGEEPEVAEYLVHAPSRKRLQWLISQPG
jgi:hypothetical protein